MDDTVLMCCPPPPLSGIYICLDYTLLLGDEEFSFFAGVKVEHKGYWEQEGGWEGGEKLEGFCCCFE